MYKWFLSLALQHIRINASCYLDHNILHAISALSLDKNHDLTFALVDKRYKWSCTNPFATLC